MSSLESQRNKTNSKAGATVSKPLMSRYKPGLPQSQGKNTLACSSSNPTSFWTHKACYSKPIAPVVTASPPWRLHCSTGSCKCAGCFSHPAKGQVWADASPLQNPRMVLHALTLSPHVPHERWSQHYCLLTAWVSSVNPLQAYVFRSVTSLTTQSGWLCWLGKITQLHIGIIVPWKYLMLTAGAQKGNS